MQSPHGNGLLTGNLRVGYMSRQRHPALEKKQDGTGRRHADRKKRPLPINHLRWKNHYEISYINEEHSPNISGTQRLLRNSAVIQRPKAVQHPRPHLTIRKRQSYLVLAQQDAPCLLLPFIVALASFSSAESCPLHISCRNNTKRLNENNDSPSTSAG